MNNEITVGVKSADIIGRDEKAIQSAIMLAKSRNISRVRLLPGIYNCKNSIWLKSGLELIGAGELSIIRREPPQESPLIASAHHYERVIAVKHPDLFPVGCGIKIEGIRRLSRENISVRATVAAKNGHQLLLDRPYLGENFWLEEGPARASTLVPLIYGENLRDLSLRQLRLDGNISFRAMEYCGGHGIYLKNCQRALMRAIHSHNNNGDGIGFEISNDVTVEDCTLENNAMALHAGSGALRMHVRRNKIINNQRGFYFCWGIQQGILEDNEIRANAAYGVSLGFHDSRNLVRRNKICNNGEVGIIFRAAHHPGQAPRDDIVEENLLENNGPKDAALGIKICYHADNIRISGNKIAEKRRGKKSCGIFIEKTVGRVQIENNSFSGCKKEIQDCRPKKRKLTKA